MTTKISANRIKQIIREEAARANARWYMVNEEAPVEEDEVIVELLDEEEEAEEPAEEAPAAGGGLKVGDVLTGKKDDWKYEVTKLDTDIDNVEVIVKSYPPKKSIEGKYKFLLGKIKDDHPLKVAAQAKMDEKPAPPSGDTAAKEAPPKDTSKKAQMDDVGAKSGLFKGEKYLSKDGKLLKEKEFGWYKLKSPVTAAHPKAGWLLDNKSGSQGANQGGMNVDGKGPKRAVTDLVTHVRIVFNEKQTLSKENLVGVGAEKKVKWIQFKLARKGLLKGSADYDGAWNGKAADLALYMLNDLGYREHEPKADDADADEGTLSESWKRIIG